jgi:putative transposase
MAWKVPSVMDEKMKFVAECLSGEASMTDLCARYGISRETGHVLKRRYLLEGPAGLAKRSRAPHAHGRETPAALIEPILSLRRRKPHWGPKKLLAVLAREAPRTAWPPSSTVSRILKREGLVAPRETRRRRIPQEAPFQDILGPNDTWCIDFKGWFQTLDGQRCDPLTVTDAYSRYLLACTIARPTTEGVRAEMALLFHEHGLPAAIRSDNGTPFASAGAAGLCPLSVWWAKLGIRLELILPGHPEQNGRHERMHRTLKAETTLPPAANMAQQQLRFDAFVQEYNMERPHEALNQTPPASHWHPSIRPYPYRIEEPWYDSDHLPIKIRSNGSICWGDDNPFVSSSLAGETVGIIRLENGDYMVRFIKIPVGLIVRKTNKFIPFGPARPPCGLRPPGSRAGPKGGNPAL